MKIQLIKEYEIGDIVFFTDPGERRNLVRQVHPVSLFGQITNIEDGMYTIQFLSEDGMLYNVTIDNDDDLFEWFDLLYDMGPSTISVKYGDDVSQNFNNRGLFFKSWVRSVKHGRLDYEPGDVVFDLDPRAELWFDAYIANNKHADVFGVIDSVQVDSNNTPVFVVNYGDDMGLNRYAYQIASIDRFPRIDDPWYDEYVFTRDDNIMMDIYKAGGIDQYKATYIDELKKREEENGGPIIPMTNTPIIEPPKKEESKPHLPTAEELHEEYMGDMHEATKDIEVDTLNSGDIVVDTANSGDYTAIENSRKDTGIEKIEATWMGEDPLTKNSQTVNGSTTLIDPE